MDSPERFHPTGGRFTGWAGVVIGLVLAVEGALNQGWGRCFGGALFAAVAWVASLRPALWVDEEDLTIRAMVSTVRVPLAAIRELTIQQVLAVGAGDRRYVSPVVGRSLRRSLRPDENESVLSSYPLFVEQRIRQLAEAARHRAGVRMGSAEQGQLAQGVRRRLDRPVVALLVVLAVAWVSALVW